MINLLKCLSLSLCVCVTHTDVCVNICNMMHWTPCMRNWCLWSVSSSSFTFMKFTQDRFPEHLVCFRYCELNANLYSILGLWRVERYLVSLGLQVSWPLSLICVHIFILSTSISSPLPMQGSYIKEIRGGGW